MLIVIPVFKQNIREYKTGRITAGKHRLQLGPRHVGKRLAH